MNFYRVSTILKCATFDNDIVTGHTAMKTPVLTRSHIFASCKRKMICATTIFILISHTALVAQWIARWIPNPKVRGSNPRWGNTILSF